MVCVRTHPFSENPHIEEEVLPGLDLQVDSKNSRLRLHASCDLSKISSIRIEVCPQGLLKVGILILTFWGRGLEG